jgi:hypothetical protein
MSLFLTSDANARAGTIRVSAPLSNPSYPIFYDLDSETIKVTDHADTTQWEVERGVAGTNAARHARSTFLVPNASPYGGGGSGVTVDNGSDPPAAVTTLVAPGAVIAGDSATLPLSVQLIGPFPIAFDDTNIDNGDVGVILAPLDQGVLIVRAWMEVTSLWAYGQSAAFHVIVAPDSDPTDGLDVAIYIAATLGVQGDAHIIGEASASTRSNATARMVEVGHLAAWTSVTPTSGAGNIYAIIATPA